MFDKNELAILEELLNEEIESYCQSGYSVKSEYVVRLRNMIKKLGLREFYDFDKRFSRKEK